MSNKSKLSCTCWNSYIRNYLVSTDYDGVVKLWDAGTGQGISQYIEHGRRAWSVVFSQVDPTKLASGSDACSVKLWNISEKNSLCTIRNIANVCCVQFSTKSSHFIAFGSADYKTYCYHLRNVSTPGCTLTGHHNAVSCMKFLDSETPLSASTDNTLKLWDLSKTTTRGFSTNAGILTLRGHTNEKNFVGLSVANDGYIAYGSETNEVFAYYRCLPMPITSRKFGFIDPISGKETDDDGGQFVSSVCWRQKSNMVVAANSSGSIKLLQMI